MLHKIIGAPEKFKTQLRPLVRPSTVSLCQIFKNLSHETVPLTSRTIGVNLNLMPRGQVVTHCRANLSLTSFYRHAGDPTIRLLLEVFASVNQRLYTVHLCTISKVLSCFLRTCWKQTILTRLMYRELRKNILKKKKFQRSYQYNWYDNCEY